MRREQTNRRNLRSNRLSSYFNYTPFRTIFKALILFGIGTLAYSANTPTTRVGLQKPAINDTGWGTTINKNWDIADSSMCAQGVANTFTSTNTFNQPILIQGQPIRFYDTSTHYIEFQSPGVVTTTLFKWPIGDGSPNQILQTDGSGNLSWSAPGNASALLSTTNTWTATQAFNSNTTLNNELDTSNGAGTNGQLLQSRGSASSPIWISQSALNAGNTNYIQNAAVLQAGATLYVSSGTFGNGGAVTPLTIQGNTVLFQNSQNQNSNLFNLSFYETGSGGAVETLRAKGTTTIGLNDLKRPGFSIISNSGIQKLFFNAADDSNNAQIVIPSTASISFNGQGFRGPTTPGTDIWVLPTGDGTANQGLGTDGSHNLSFLPFTLPSSSITWTGQNTWSSPATQTFNFGVSAGTMTSTEYYGSTSFSPSISTNTGAGTSGNPTITTPLTNAYGLITLTTGSSAATNSLIFSSSPTYVAPLKIICSITPGNSNAAALSGTSAVSFTSSNSFWGLVSGSAALANTTVYTWVYHCGGY